MLFLIEVVFLGSSRKFFTTLHIIALIPMIMGPI